MRTARYFRCLCCCVLAAVSVAQVHALEVKTRRPTADQMEEYSKDERKLRKFMWEALLDGELSAGGINHLKATAIDSELKMSEIVSDAKRQGASREKLEALEEKRVFFEQQAKKLGELYNRRVVLEMLSGDNSPRSNSQARKLLEEFDTDLRSLKALLSKAP